MTTWRNPLTMTSSGFVLRLRKPKFFRANYVPYSCLLYTSRWDETSNVFGEVESLDYYPPYPDIPRFRICLLYTSIMSGMRYCRMQP